MSDRARIYFTGDCEGFDALRDAITNALPVRSQAA